MKARTARREAWANVARERASKATMGVAMIALALLTAAGARGQGQAPAHEDKLPNPPVLLPVAGDPTVSFKIAFAVGSQDDPAGKEGLAYLTAVTMAEGATARHSYPEILKLLYPMAADYSVRVDKERITFTGRVHRDNLDSYLGLLLDAVLRPAFAPADLERLRQRTLDGIEKTLRYASDEELGKAALYDDVFAGTPYGHLKEGTVAGLKAITLDDVRAFYRARFTRASVTLGLGGGFEDALAAGIEKELLQLPAGEPAKPPALAIRPVEGRRLVIVKKPGPATAISFGLPIALKRSDPDFAALWVANSWLGEHRSSSSHLYQVIREARGMNYGDYSYIEIFPEGGRRTMPPTGVPRRQQLFEVWIRPVPNAQAHFALRAAIREVERLATDGLTKDQFELTRAFVSKYSLHFAETTLDRLGYAMDDRFWGIPAPGHLARFRAALANLTLADVNAAIRRYITPANLVIAMVSEDAERLATAVPAETPSPISYTTPKPQAVLDEDKVIASWPVRIAKNAVRVVPVESMFAK